MRQRRVKEHKFIVWQRSSNVSGGKVTKEGWALKPFAENKSINFRNEKLWQNVAEASVEEQQLRLFFTCPLASATAKVSQPQEQKATAEIRTEGSSSLSFERCWPWTFQSSWAILGRWPSRSAWLTLAKMDTFWRERWAREAACDVRFIYFKANDCPKATSTKVVGF